jgi:hypothetical protein
MSDGFLRTVLDQCVAQGCAVDKTTRGHIRVRLPNGGQVVTSGTPSDYRATRNFVGDLRRRGLNLRIEEPSPKQATNDHYYKELSDLFERENAELVGRLRHLVTERDASTRRADQVAKRLARLEEKHARLCAAHDHHETQAALLRGLFERLVAARVSELAPILSEMQATLAALDAHGAPPAGDAGTSH